MKINAARRSLAWAFASWAGTAVGAVAAAPLQVQVVDDATGQTVSARAYLWRGGEPLLPGGFSSYARGDERHFLVPGDFELDLEPGKYRLRIERGLEYVPVELVLDVPRSTPVPVRLRRWIDMNRDGWYSADMHVHRDPAEIPLILRAEDLNFVPTVTTHVWSTEVSQPWKWPLEFPVKVEANRLFTANAQEVERIQGGPGAVTLLAKGCRSRSMDTSSILRRSATRERPTRWEASSKGTSSSGSIPSSTPPSARSISSS